MVVNKTEVCPAEAELAFNDANRVAGLVLFIVMAVYFPATIAWWWSRRKHPVLQRRSFTMMCTAAVGASFQFVTAGLTNYLGRQAMPCDVFLLLTYLLIPLGAGPIAVRLVIFHNTARYQNLLLDRSKKSSSLKKMVSFKNKNGTARGLKAWLRQKLKAFKASETKSIAVDKDDDEEDGEDPMEMDRRVSRSSSHGYALHFSTTRTFALMVEGLFVSIAAAIIIMFMADSSGPYGGKGCHSCTISGNDFVPFSVQALIIFVLGMYMLFVVRNSPDPMNILKELRLCWATAFLMVVGMGLSIVDPGNLRADGTFDWLYLVSLSILVFHTIQCPWQVLKTYRSKKISQSAADMFSRSMKKLKIGFSVRDEVSLNDVLSTPAGKRAFERYLETEFSLENILFMDAVERYKEEYDSGSNREVGHRALEIYSSYIEEGSMMEVNVSAGVRRRVKTTLESLIVGQRVSDKPKPPEEVFDLCLSEVMRLLESDSFPRFTKSKIFKEWMENSDEENVSSYVSSSNV